MGEAREISGCMNHESLQLFLSHENAVKEGKLVKDEIEPPRVQCVSPFGKYGAESRYIQHTTIRC